METTDTPRWSFARRFVAGTAAALAAVVWTHGLAGVLRHLVDDAAPPAAVPLTLAALAVAVVGAAALPRRGVLAAAATGLAAVLAVELAAPGAWAAALAVPVAGAAATACALWLGRRLPAGVDLALRRRRRAARIAAAAWALVSVLAVAQVARLATFITDPTQGFVLATDHPFWNGHQCLPAYLHGAELAGRGVENVYDAAHYPGLNPEARPETEIAGMVVEDPFQYPPQFLLLPGLGLALSDDLTTLRTVWFALQVSLFAAVFAALALWVGGRAGRLALWAGPAVLAAFPVLYNFQFGQFHLAAVALAVGAMLAFSGRRRALGGFLLTAAILAKVFPAVLLVPLLVRRRFRELAWTAGWAVALTAVTLAVFGAAPFAAFFDYHLPRLGNGAAFAFDEAWPELADLVVADNQGVYGLARKLGVGKPAAAVAGRVFSVAVLVLAGFAAHRFRDASRWGRAALWLALLGLASMASPGAWGDYVPSTAVWLLALLVARAATDRRWRAPLAVAAVFACTLVGTYPIAGWQPIALMTAVSAAGVVVLLALFGAVLASDPARWRSGRALAAAGGEPEVPAARAA